MGMKEDDPIMAFISGMEDMKPQLSEKARKKQEKRRKKQQEHAGGECSQVPPRVPQPCKEQRDCKKRYELTGWIQRPHGAFPPSA